MAENCTPSRVTHDSGEIRPGDPRSELIAAVALVRAHLMTDERLAAAFTHMGSAVEVFVRVAAGELPADNGRPVLAKPSESDLRRAEIEVAEWEREGYDVRTVLDPGYPGNLQAIFDKPPLVFIAGTWDERRDQFSVAVVGTRRPSDRGIDDAAELARELVAQKITVISGLAAGIDTAAHSSALDSGGRTVAVMGTGINRRYPRANAALAERILHANGALVTQFFPDDGPLGWHFPKRNVVMSGLSLATVVVEAAETSGARTQARAALRHGRSVFLCRSVVERTAWASRFVEVGINGTRAIAITSARDMLKHFSAGRFRRLRLAN